MLDTIARHAVFAFIVIMGSCLCIAIMTITYQLVATVFK